MLDQFTVKDADGTTDIVFNLQSVGGDFAIYRSEDSTLQAPLTLKVALNLKAVGSKGSDRRTVLVQEAFQDDNGATFIDSVSMTQTTARSVAATEARQKRVMAVARNYLSLAGTTDALLDGMYP